MSVAADLRNAPEDVPTSAMVNKTSKKKLRVIMLADEKLLPAGELKDFSEKQRELRKTEFDVRDAIETLGHEVFSIGVSDDLSTIPGAIDAHKPHVAFNLVEEFGGIGHFDQHVVSYLELRRQAYTGCNPRGLTLARDKALTKKILAYHGLKVPEFAIFAKRRATKRPESLAFPLFVKSLTEEGRLGFRAHPSYMTMRSSRSVWSSSIARRNRQRSPSNSSRDARSTSESWATIASLSCPRGNSR